MREEFFKESTALILMYDITKRRSFENLDNWHKEAQRFGGEALPVYVVGSKADLDDRRAVPRAEAEKFAKTKNAIGYYECSAKANDGFLRIFREMADNS